MTTLRRAWRWVGSRRRPAWADPRRWTRHDWIWLGLAAGATANEVWALRDRRPGGTLSEVFWWLRDSHRLVRVALLSLTAWVVAHFWARRNWV